VHRYFVTGTDTDVGKTRVSAALALALRLAGQSPTLVKLVQTGLTAGVPGDAARAGTLAGVGHVELARFEKAADPWSAALAQGASPLRAGELAAALDSIDGPIVVEGVGGVMVPLNRDEHAGHVPAQAKLEVVVVVGLRLGCLNHTLLTLNLCDRLRIPVAGGVLVERWPCNDRSYPADVLRALQGKLRIFGILPFAPGEASSVKSGAKLFEGVLKE
jgi:dethiobiotin synthetase